MGLDLADVMLSGRHRLVSSKPYAAIIRSPFFPKRRKISPGPGLIDAYNSRVNGVGIA
jgi:hypothetical protein